MTAIAKKVDALIPENKQLVTLLIESIFKAQTNTTRAEERKKERSKSEPNI